MRKPTQTRLRKALKKLSTPQSGWLDVFPAIMGRSDGVVRTGIPGMVWVRNVLNGQVLAVYNSTTPNITNLQVEVGRRVDQPALWQVKGTLEPFSVPSTGGAGTTVGEHHESHEFPASDTVWVDRKQIKQLSVLVYDQAAFKVVLLPGIVRTATGWTKINKQILDLSSYIPSAGARFVAIETDDSGVASAHSGDVFASPQIGGPGDFPAPASGKHNRAFVLLFEGQPALLNEHIIVPMPPDVAASSSSVPYDLDDLNDVDAAAPTAGQVLTWDDGAAEWIASDPPTGTMMVDDLTSQIPAASDHFDLATEATGTVLLFYNATYQSPSTYTMDGDNLGLTTSFSPAAGDTLIAVYGIGIFSTVTDQDAIHDNVAGEINALTEKAALVSGDMALIEDSQASFAKKKTNITNLLGWTQVVDENGASFVNWSGGATWSVSGGNIVQSDTGAAIRRAYYTIKIPHSAVVFEAEVQQKNDVSGAEVGLIVGFDGTGNNGIAVHIRTFNDDVEVEQDGAASAALLSASGLAIDTWYKLRLVVFGNTVSVYLAGNLLGTARVSHGNMNAPYIGLRTNTTAGWFRNIKAWVLNQP